ncbi:MAG: 23S rRNA (guanosine(2251)-2'-O)-methyltransferase RlmB [Candidatus Omnitrophica bacterium]|nr:23S rRNA (guanosine(2251)-2'-O)-methyltransferase RlmB [Candidatus Omnitrophota bacterium]
MNHSNMRLFGKNPVTERLRTNPHSIRTIYIENGFTGAGYFYKKAKQWDIPVQPVLKTKMQKISRNANAQGIFAVVDDYDYIDFNELLESVRPKKRTLVFLDNVQDPQNLGAILRTLGCFGHFALVIPSHKSVSVTETVLRIASGGENYVPIAVVSNLRNAIKKAKEQDIQMVGSVIQGGEKLTDMDFDFPVAVILGSEEKGLRDVIAKEVDINITIPMYMDRMSFNVAHAASIIAYEITRQKIEKKLIK